MEIVKAFNNNELHANITIKETIEKPLFRASDIGEILGFNNIRQTIKDYDNTEKDAVTTSDSTGRKQSITFLTEKGLYKVLFKSRKPIAEKFQNWVCEVIKEIRLNGVYDLQNNLIREFSCKYDCLKTLLISDKTLAKALDKEKQYNGFYYKSIGSKLKCV
jgi:prophage antirepressor-like protein